MRKRKLKQSANIQESHPRVEALPRYKCLVRIVEERLEISRILNERWEPVIHPVGQDFLDLVNELFQTRYTERDFHLEAIQTRAKSPSIYFGR